MHVENSKEHTKNPSLNLLETYSDSTDDEIFSDSGSKPSHSVKNNKTKYKTELCRNYSEKGWCPYGDKCQYAHGYHDVQMGPCCSKKSGYRTRKCKSFWNDGQCSYGKRCQFSHYEPNPISKACLSLHLYLIEDTHSEHQSRLLSILNV